MKEKDKKSKSGLSDFLRYRGMEMRGRERNAFERELQKDPFSEEASEGLESVAPGQIGSDMRKMKEKLSGRTRRVMIPLLYRVAASLFIIVAAGSLVILSTRKSGNTDKNIAIVSKLSVPSDTIKADTEQVAYPQRIVSMEKAAEPAFQKKAETAKRDETISAPAAETISDDEVKAAVAFADTATVLKAAEEAYKSENINARAVAAPAAMVTDIRKSETMIKGRVISSEDNLPLPGVAIQIKGTTIGTMTDVNGNFSFPSESASGQQLVASYIGMKSLEFVAKKSDFNEIKLDPDITALNEVVVVGYGTARKQEATGAATRIEMSDKTPYLKYNPPEPESGREAYDRYIEDNIRKPVDFREGERIIVVVTFVVTRNGAIDSLKILRSGGESFSSEAARLIKEGPSWRPATENGIKIDDEVRIRIVFK
jgi:hypothetical protein